MKAFKYGAIGSVILLGALALLVFMLSGCTMFAKSSGGSDELEKLSEDVLKKDKGLEIDIKPIEKVK